MKIVTIAKVTLNRPGSLTRSAFARVGRDSPRKIISLVLEDDSPNGLLSRIKELALKEGEIAENLEVLELSLIQNTKFTCNESDAAYRSTKHSLVYAEGEIFPALELEGRYFKLSEEKIAH